MNYKKDIYSIGICYRCKQVKALRNGICTKCEKKQLKMPKFFEDLFKGDRL